MHKPVVGARILEEIVEEIVVHLRPWQRGRTEAAVTDDVNHALGVLLKLVPLEKRLADRTANREHARKLDGALNKVEMLLTSAPAILAWFLFDPLPPVVFSDDHQYPLAQSMPYKSIEDIERAYEARAASFVTELRRLRKICARAIDPGFGAHPNYGHAKHMCAYFAHSLMRGLSSKKPTGTKDDSFRTIASLLYEAVSGQARADLKRACDKVLRGEP